MLHFNMILFKITFAHLLSQSCHRDGDNDDDDDDEEQHETESFEVSKWALSF